MAPSYKEMSLQLRKRALRLLLSQLENGVLPWGSFTIVADEIGVARSTISRLWRQAHGAREQSWMIWEMKCFFPCLQLHLRLQWMEKEEKTHLQMELQLQVSNFI